MSNTVTKIVGKVHVILDKQTFDSGFVKQVLVVETDDKYPQTIPIEFTKDHIEMLKGVQVGDNVEVNYNLRGNEYNGKFYCNVQAWAISIKDSPPKPCQNDTAQDSSDEHDEVPF